MSTGVNFSGGQKNTNVMQHCAGFISAESLYMFRALSARHQEYLKTGTAAPGTGVL